MRTILVFTYLPRHLKKLLPLLRTFQAQSGKVRLVLLLMTQEEKKLAEDAGLACRMLDEYTDQPRDRDFDLAWGLEPLLNALEQERPDLFVVIEVNYILRNAIRHCKQKHIRNLVIQHGTPNPYSLHAFAPFEGDCFAAWGSYSRAWLTPYFLDPGKLRLTGGMNFDRLSTLQPDRQQLARELRIPADGKWVLFTTQTTGAGGLPTEKEIQEGVVEAALALKGHPDWQMIYQVHPSQTVEAIAGIVNPLGVPNARVMKYRDTEMLIAACDGMITFFSTTAIDAIVLRKPLLLINLEEDQGFFPFVKKQAALGAYRPEEIQRQVQTLLQPGLELPGQEAMASEMNYMNDGKALERVQALCWELMG